MRVMAIEESIGLDNLRLGERPVPEPGPGQILVRLKAASLNYRDLMTVLGTYSMSPKLPLVPLSDGYGVVEAIGPKVRRVKVGDRVATTFFQNWIGGRAPENPGPIPLGGPLDGCLQEYLTLSEDGVVAIPDYLSDMEAGSLTCAAVTAWRGLMVDTKIVPGDVVLCQGTGGVSLFALQFAKAAGAAVILTSSSDEKLERGRALGADYTINYRAHPEWGAEARRLVPGGVDVVVEVGGSDTMAESFKAIRPDGHISVIGLLSGPELRLQAFNLFRNRATVKGVMVGSRQNFEDMLRAMERHRINPVIDSVYPMARTADALRHMQAGAHFGKIGIEL